jgi:hypothetical protein
VIAALALAGLSACSEGRFPVCKTNADCTDKDAGLAGPVCYNLKCVECHSDTDCKCKSGETCSPTNNECESLGTAREPIRDASIPEPVPWEHGTWDQCAADCKDSHCIEDCDLKFNK